MHPIAEGVSPLRWRRILRNTRDEPIRFVLQLPEQPADFRRLRLYDRCGLQVGTLGWQVCDLHRRGFIAKISIVPEWQRQGVGRRIVRRALEDGPGYAWMTSSQSDAARQFFPVIAAEAGISITASHDRCAHMMLTQTPALGRGILLQLH